LNSFFTMFAFSPLATDFNTLLHPLSFILQGVCFWGTTFEVLSTEWSWWNFYPWQAMKKMITVKMSKLLEGAFFQMLRIVNIQSLFCNMKRLEVRCKYSPIELLGIDSFLTCNRIPYYISAVYYLVLFFFPSDYHHTRAQRRNLCVFTFIYVFS
jgi:hypothetical protein